MFSYEAESRLTSAALAVLLQQLSLRTDAVVRARSAHTLVLTAVLHCVTQVQVCKYTVYTLHTDQWWKRTTLMEVLSFRQRTTAD